MTDFIHMGPAATAGFIGRLEQTVDAFGTAWRGSAAEITTGEGGVGSGRLAAAFLGGYEGPAAHTRAVAARIQPVYAALCATGHQAVAGYRAADQAGADQLNAVT